MTAAQLAARSKGGTAFKERYGMSWLGKQGGRPRAITIKEVELAQSLSQNTKEDGDPSTDSLIQLRRLWAKRRT